MFFGKKDKKIDIDFGYGTVRVDQIDYLKSQLKKEEKNIVKDIDTIINETINDIIDVKPSIYSVSPSIISPSEIGIKEENILKNKIKELEKELSNTKNMLEDSNKMKIYAAPMKTIRINIEIPSIVMSSMDPHINSKYFYDNKGVILPSNTGFKYSLVDGFERDYNNALDNFVKFEIYGYTELKSERRYFNERRVCQLTFAKDDSLAATKVNL